MASALRRRRPAGEGAPRRQEAGARLFYCQFTWFPGTTRAQVARRVVEQHDAGANNPERLRGWCILVGGEAA